MGERATNESNIWVFFYNPKRRKEAKKRATRRPSRASSILYTASARRTAHHAPHTLMLKVRRLPVTCIDHRLSCNARAEPTFPFASCAQTSLLPIPFVVLVDMLCRYAPPAARREEYVPPSPDER